MQNLPVDTDNWAAVKKRSEEALTPEIVAYIAQCREKEFPESELIGVLHKVQAHFGYLPQEALDAVAQLLQVPVADVAGVASFYHFFRLEARGKHLISICLGTACYVKGANRVAEKIQEELGVEFGETTTDGLFTLEGSRCLGTCGLAPVMTIDEDVHAQVTPEKIPAILAAYTEKT